MDFTRRNLLRTAATGRAALAVAATAAPSITQTPARRPNIVLIVADDMGYADVSCYGQLAANPETSVEMIESLYGKKLSLLKTLNAGETPGFLWLSEF